MDFNSLARFLSISTIVVTLAGQVILKSTLACVIFMYMHLTQYHYVLVTSTIEGIQLVCNGLLCSLLINCTVYHCTV